MTLPGDDPALEREKLHAEIARLVSLLEAQDDLPLLFWVSGLPRGLDRRWDA